MATNICFLQDSEIRVYKTVKSEKACHVMLKRKITVLQKNRQSLWVSKCGCVFVVGCFNPKNLMFQICIILPKINKKEVLFYILR